MMTAASGKGQIKMHNTDGAAVSPLKPVLMLMFFACFEYVGLNVSVHREYSVRREWSSWVLCKV